MRWTGSSEHRVLEELAATSPGVPTASVDAATGHALWRLARRYRYLTSEIDEREEDLRELVGIAAPAMIANKGSGVSTTAPLLVTAGSKPVRLRASALFAA